MVSECCISNPAKHALESLNPCFSGGWSRRHTPRVLHVFYSRVLILVLVEDGLGAPKNYIYGNIRCVLILVLVEDGLGEQRLELTVSETVVTKFLISLTFGDQKYVPFRVLSQMQIYEFSVSANMFFEDISEFFCVDA